ncbi:hypothetical protein BU16DRAFT_577053 [Lophium mytilinum]|uniref:C2H2-type domain-containing protein n=1 Tax=Lophium mytilinum TaxID=390894 RepID=A0A6A6REV2_9PEZI|nr:hypothetical protein BU16DRAFT_577053 [Lophium mytilinum]
MPYVPRAAHVSFSRPRGRVKLYRSVSEQCAQPTEAEPDHTHPKRVRYDCDGCSSTFPSRSLLISHTPTRCRRHGSSDATPSSTGNVDEANYRHARSKRPRVDSPGRGFIESTPPSTHLTQLSSHPSESRDSTYGSLPQAEETGFYTRTSSPPNTLEPEVTTPYWNDDRFSEWTREERLHRVERYAAEALSKCPKEINHHTSAEGKYQCTSGCGASSKRKDDFKQHEEIRYPQQVWICVLCPSSIHEAFITHRQDQLGLHIDNGHSGYGDPRSKLIRASQVDYVADFPRTCGFCDLSFETWLQRVQHIATHFENGLTMSQWMEASPSERPRHFGHDDKDQLTTKFGKLSGPLSAFSYQLRLPVREKGQIDSESRLPATQPPDAMSQEHRNRSPNQARIERNPKSTEHISSMQKDTDDASKSFDYLVSQLHSVRDPSLVNKCFRRWDASVQVLNFKFEDNVDASAFSRALGRPDQGTRPFAQRTHRFDVSTHAPAPSIAFELPRVRSQNSLDPNAFLRLALHRSPGLGAAISHGKCVLADIDFARQRAGCQSQLTSGQPLRTPNNFDLAGLGSHLTQDHVKQAARGVSSNTSPVATKPTETGISTNSGQSGTRVSSQRSIGKRSRGFEREDSEGEDDGTQKKLKALPSKGGDTEKATFACPVHKYEELENVQQDERDCIGGYLAKTMSDLRRHLKSHKTYLENRGLIVPQYCKQCKILVVDQMEWDGRHKRPQCQGTRPQPRRKDVLVHWEDLYTRLYPHVHRIPDPRNGFPNVKLRVVPQALPHGQPMRTPTAISQAEDQDQAVLFQQESQPEVVLPGLSDNAARPGLQSHPFSDLGRDQDLRDGEHTLGYDMPWPIGEQIPHARATQGACEMPSSQDPDQTRPGASHDTLTKTALISIRQFMNVFLKLTETLPQAELKTFTCDVWYEFYAYLKSHGDLLNDIYPNTVSTGERIDFSFKQDFETVANGLSPERQFLATIHLKGWIRCYKTYGPGLQQRPADSQVPIDFLPTTFPQYTAQADYIDCFAPEASMDPANIYGISQGDFHDSAQGSRSDPTNPNDASDNEPQETIDPRLRYV